MKFVKGLVLGGMVATGVIMMLGETDVINKKKIMKKGRKFVKQMGIM